jgi:hypothetical protein
MSYFIGIKRYAAGLPCCHRAVTARLYSVDGRLVVMCLCGKEFRAAWASL